MNTLWLSDGVYRNGSDAPWPLYPLAGLMQTANGGLGVGLASVKPILVTEGYKDPLSRRCLATVTNLFGRANAKTNMEVWMGIPHVYLPIKRQYTSSLFLI